MRRGWRIVVLAVALGCGAGPTDTGTDGVVDTDGDGLPDDSPIDGPNGVTCPNALRPAKTLQCSGATPVCCLGGPLGLSPRCVEDLAACGQETRLACDGANDCAEGQACCMMELGGGQSTTYVGQCKNACSLFEQQVCNGEGTCKGAKSCCQLEGDVWGQCLASCEGYGETGR